jgi:hypothetical protein
MSKNRCPLFTKLKKPRLVKFFVKDKLPDHTKTLCFLKDGLVIG